MESSTSESVVSADVEINRLWLSGDPAALGRAHERYGTRLEGVAYRILGNRADAEDVVQRVFLALQRVTASGTASLWTYLYRSAINGSLSLLRTRKRRATLESENLEQFLMGQSGAGDAESRLLEDEMLGAVSRALLKVGPRYRQVLSLRIVWNLSNVEIAEREGIPVATVRTRVRRGREELRKHLGPLLRDLGRAS